MHGWAGRCGWEILWERVRILRAARLLAKNEEIHFKRFVRIYMKKWSNQKGLPFVPVIELTHARRVHESGDHDLVRRRLEAPGRLPYFARWLAVGRELPMLLLRKDAQNILCGIL